MSVRKTRISREWATPLTIGVFFLMSVTGLLLFFHLDTGLNKVVHEWAGWVMVAGAGAHIVVNWVPFARYCKTSVPGRLIIGSGLLVLGLSFISPPGNSGPPPTARAVRSIIDAPLSGVAQMVGRPVEAVISDLRQAGIAIEGPQSTIASAARGDRRLEFLALNALFPGKQ